MKPDWKFGDMIRRTGAWSGDSPPENAIFIAWHPEPRSGPDEPVLLIYEDENSVSEWPDHTLWRKRDDSR